MNVLALDLSSSATGVATNVGTTTIVGTGELHHRARAMRDVIRGFLPGADLVIAEAIGTRHVATAIAIATVHALVREAIDQAGVPLVLVEPAALKKWATGKGSGPTTSKAALTVAALRAGWNPGDDATDDQADAWWLWTLGHAYLGDWRVPETACRREVLGRVTG